MKIEQEEAVAVNTASVSANSFADKNSVSTAPALADDFRAQVTRLVREGITEAKAGNLPVARETLLKAISLDNRHETALMWLASISDKPHQLLDYLQQVLAINPANERAAQWATATKSLLAKSLIQQGAASHKEGMPEIAAQYFLQATEYEPTSEMAWLWLVSVAIEPEDKLSYLNRVLSLNPTHEKALALFHRTKTQIARSLLKKGNAAAVSGDSETAREILRDVMEYNPNLEEAWLLKAFLSDAGGEQAFCFERALEINPESVQARSGLDALHAQAAEKAREAAADEDSPAEQPDAVAETSFQESDLEETPITQHLTEITAPAGTQSEEVLVDDDSAPTQFVADTYVASDSVNEESVEEDLVREQISAVAEVAAAAAESPAKFSSLPSDFSGFVAPPAPKNPVPDEQTDAERRFTEERNAAENTTAASMPETSDEGFFEATAQKMPEAKVECQFCRAENKEGIVRCQGCGAFVYLEKFEQLLANELNDEERMRGFIETWQAESAGRELTADEYFNLGLAYLNLRNVKKAVGNFEQVVGLNPSSGKWNAHITAFLAYINEKMPEVLGNNASHSGKTIMVVDDSPTVRKLIVGKLEKYGHRVVSAVDGMDALSKINETVPDLILLDVTMPRLDGYQLCKLVKANAKTKHVPVVMISGKDGFFDKVRGRMAGSTAYITKPFGPETLLQTVESYCA